jgi:hypothetical protein
VNYLAHSLRFLDDEWRLAGACLPDWLRVVDRRARVHVKDLDAHPPADDVEARIDVGVRAHHDDDHRFHLDATFDALTHEVVHEVRALDRDPQFRASTIGHILVEMLLDAALMERFPGCGERYYDTLASVRAEPLARFVAVRVGREVPRIPVLLERFTRARFILDYLDDDGVHDAMDGVMMRTGLPAVPRAFPSVVARARPRVAEGLVELLARGVLAAPGP